MIQQVGVSLHSHLPFLTFLLVVHSLAAGIPARLLHAYDKGPGRCETERQWGHSPGTYSRDNRCSTAKLGPATSNLRVKR